MTDLASCKTRSHYHIKHYTPSPLILAKSSFVLICNHHKFHFVVVPVLTYLLTTQNLSLEEVNGLAIDVIFGGVDTVSS